MTDPEEIKRRSITEDFSRILEGVDDEMELEITIDNATYHKYLKVKVVRHIEDPV